MEVPRSVAASNSWYDVALAPHGRLIAFIVVILCARAPNAAAQPHDSSGEAVKSVALELLESHREVFDSSVPNSSFMYQRVACRSDDGETANSAMRLREIVDFDGQRGIYALFGLPNLPTKVLVDNSLFNLRANPPAWQCVDDFQWLYCFDGEHYDGCFRSGRLHEPGPPSIRIEPIAFARMVLDQGNLSMVWDEASRTLASESREGDQLLVRFRTEADEQRFGSGLSFVRGQTSAGAVISASGFCTTAVPYARLSEGQLHKLATLAAARPISEGQNSFETQLGHLSRDACAKAEDMWRLLLKERDSLDSRQTQTMVEIAKADALLEASLRSMLEATPGADTASANREQIASDTIHAALIAESVHRLLDAMNSLDSTEGILYPDDPHLRWLRTEYFLGPEKANRYYFGVFLPIIRDRAMVPSARAKLLAALALLGVPALEKEECIFGGVDIDRYSEAILRSRCCVPCSAEHISACKDVIAVDESESGVMDAAITTLALLDQLDQVPAAKQAEWLDRQVNQAGKIRRLRNLSEISQQPSALKLLEAKANAGFFKPEAMTDVKRVIDARQSAVSP